MRKIRKIPIQSRSVAGSFFSITNNKRIEFESQLEKKIFLMLEYDENVDKYIEQPIRILGEINNKKVTYIPDVYIIYKNKKEVIGEIKYKSEIDKKDEKLINKLETIQSYCLKNGYKFRVFTDENLNETLLKNIEFLRLHRIKPKNFDDISEKIFWHLSRYGSKSIKDLLQDLLLVKEKNEVLPVIWFLLYKKELRTNLLKELSLDSTLFL